MRYSAAGRIATTNDEADGLGYDRLLADISVVFRSEELRQQIFLWRRIVFTIEVCSATQRSEVGCSTQSGTPERIEVHVLHPRP